MCTTKNVTWLVACLWDGLRLSINLCLHSFYFIFFSICCTLMTVLFVFLGLWGLFLSLSVLVHGSGGRQVSRCNFRNFSLKQIVPCSHETILTARQNKAELSLNLKFWLFELIKGCSLYLRIKCFYNLHHCLVWTSFIGLFLFVS